MEGKVEHVQLILWEYHLQIRHYDDLVVWPLGLRPFYNQICHSNDMKSHGECSSCSNAEIDCLADGGVLYLYLYTNLHVRQEDLRLTLYCSTW